MRWIELSHRWLGGLIGLLMAVIGISGAILVHRDAWTTVTRKLDAPIQETEQVAEALTKIMTDRTARTIILASPGFAVHRIAYENGGGAYTDQSGNVLVHWDSQWARPELWLSDLHRRLFSGEAGEIVIGIMGLAGVFFTVTGTILWWRTRQTFNFRLLPKRLSRPAIVRHHRDIGIMMAPLLLLSLVTGSVMVFRPLSSIVLGPGAAAAIEVAARPPHPLSVQMSRDVDWAGIVKAAHVRFPKADVRGVSLPRKGNGLITVRMKQPWEWLPNGRTTLWFAADTGRLVAAQDPGHSPTQVQMYYLLYPLHAGKVGGVAYRLVMTMSGLALGLLGTLAVWTFWFHHKRTD